MKLPDSPLRGPASLSAIATKPLDTDPDQPHRFVLANPYGSCLICGGSREIKVHV